MKKYILSDVRTGEVSLVDEGAIQRKFVIFKSKNNENPELKKGGFKPMKIEEAIELGLIDADESKRIEKKELDNKAVDNSVIKDLLASITKMFASKEQAPAKKADEVDVTKMTAEEKKAMEEKKKADACAVTKLQEDMETLKKQLADSLKGQALLVKISSCTDPKEFLGLLKEAKELNKQEAVKEEPIEKVAKVLDSISKRLETIELASKGLNGQESTATKKSSWGGAFK